METDLSALTEDRRETLHRFSDGSAYAQVEKVTISDEGGARARFAYEVEDESVKADLSWSESVASGSSSLDQEREQMLGVCQRCRGRTMQR